MHRVVVSNTTPIITLLGVGQFDLLHRLYGQIIVPETVYLEIEAGKSKAFYADLRQFDWISIQQVRDTAKMAALSSRMDAGEAAALVLAEEVKADLVLLDEKVARKYALDNGLPHVGSFGILLKAKDLGLISHIKPYLEHAQKNGIRMSQHLIQQILTEAKEN
jgi:hypothetical protein